VGDIIIDDKDIYGDGVNIAARLEALAEPGGICVSRIVRDEVRDKLQFSFEDIGRTPGQEHRAAGADPSRSVQYAGQRGSRGDGHRDPIGTTTAAKAVHRGAALYEYQWGR
jgi:hypothetical protein